jgi:hypothetical protein
MRLAVRVAILALLTILSGSALAQTALEDGASIRLLDVTLDVVGVPAASGARKVTQQIRFGGRVLLQAAGPFAIVSRAGSEAAELLVLKAGTSLELEAIAVHKGQPPEVWRLESPYGEKSIEVVREGFVVAGKPQADGSRVRMRWTVTDDWTVLERASDVEPLVEPRSVVNTHAALALVDRCAEPRSLPEAVCQRQEFQQSEADVRQALAELLPTLASDDRPAVVEALLRARNDPPRLRSDARWQTFVNKRAAEAYRASFRGELKTGNGGEPERDNRTIKVGRYELVESWLPRRYGTLGRILRLGSSVAVDSGDIGHFEVAGEAEIGDTSVILVDSPEAGTSHCHQQYLLADSPGQPLRVWTLPNRRGCNGEGLDATLVDAGYDLIVPPHPSRDGVRYRWTPAAGLTFVGPLRYQPADDDKLYPAIQRLAGASAAHFTQFLDHPERRESGSTDFELTTECDSMPAWACGYPPGLLRALRQRSTGAFYLATYDALDEFAVCGNWDARRQPTAADLRGLPIEYHPAAESWPHDALEVLRRNFCRRG